MEKPGSDSSTESGTAISVTVETPPPDQTPQETQTPVVVVTPSPDPLPIAAELILLQEIRQNQTEHTNQMAMLQGQQAILLTRIEEMGSLLETLLQEESPPETPEETPPPESAAVIPQDANAQSIEVQEISAEKKTKKRGLLNRVILGP